jgi:hypothetical protein
MISFELLAPGESRRRPQSRHEILAAVSRHQVFNVIKLFYLSLIKTTDKLELKSISSICRKGQEHTLEGST